MVFAGSVLGTLSLVIVGLRLLAKGQGLPLVAIAAIYLVNMVVIFGPGIRLRTKTLVIASNFYLFGLLSLVLAGPTGESGLWFSVSVLLCSLFAGLGPALFFAFLDLLTGLGFGLLHASGLVAWGFLGSFPLSSWLVQSANILFVDAMFLIANTVMIRGVGATFATLRLKEDELSLALADKETLIRELYHRTKNNMQVVSSLLSLHSRELESERARAVFRDVLDKIEAMSLVHKKLYESKDLSNIDLAEYIRDLVLLLRDSHGMAARGVELVFDLEKTTTLLDTALPCGLVISEIISNAFKHAFPGERKGRITISLRTLEGGLSELGIADDGVGLAEGFEPSRDRRMGMKTLFNLVKHQLQGSIDYRTGDGVAYTIRFSSSLRETRIARDA
jgi:two-component sensor histidine kinase